MLRSSNQKISENQEAKNIQGDTEQQVRLNVCVNDAAERQTSRIADRLYATNSRSGTTQEKLIAVNNALPLISRQNIASTINNTSSSESTSRSLKKKTYICPYCSKQLDHKSHFDEHIRIHTGERPYGCSYCNKRFKTKYALKGHIRTHTNERPYQCEKCGQTFVFKSNCNRHSQIDHPYKCTLCSKSFTSQDRCIDHVLVHAKMGDGQTSYAEMTNNPSQLSQSIQTPEIGFANNTTQQQDQFENSQGDVCKEEPSKND